MRAMRRRRQPVEIVDDATQLILELGPLARMSGSKGWPAQYEALRLLWRYRGAELLREDPDGFGWAGREWASRGGSTPGVRRLGPRYVGRRSDLTPRQVAEAVFGPELSFEERAAVAGDTGWRVGAQARYVDLEDLAASGPSCSSPAGDSAVSTPPPTRASSTAGIRRPHRSLKADCRPLRLTHRGIGTVRPVCRPRRFSLDRFAEQNAQSGLSTRRWCPTPGVAVDLGG